MRRFGLREAVIVAIVGVLIGVAAAYSQLH